MNTRESQGRSAVPLKVSVLLLVLLLTSGCARTSCIVGAHQTHQSKASSTSWQAAGFDPPVYLPVNAPRRLPVYAKGHGQPVLLLHEITGASPEAVLFAQELVEHGFRVYIPVLFGEFGRESSRWRGLVVCLGRDFNCLARSPSRIIGILEDVTKEIAMLHERRPLGVVGMCLTGGLSLALADVEGVSAVVVSQPSLPLPLVSSTERSVGVKTSEIRRVDVPVLVLHFDKDCLSTTERVEWLRSNLSNTIVEVHSLPGASFKAHSVLTIEAQHHSSANYEAARMGTRLVIEFLQKHLN